MYNMLLVSTDSGFLVLSQKFIPFEDPSIKVIPEGSVKDAVAALSDGPVDVIIFDHSENNDISDMIGGLNRLGRTIPIVMVSKGASKDDLTTALNEGVSAYIERGSSDPMTYFKKLCQHAIIAAERSRVNLDRNVNSRRLEAIVHMAKMTDRGFSEVVEYALEKAVELTNSEAGFVARYDKERRVLTMLAWSKGAMKRCDMTNYPVEFDLDSTGIWGEPVRTGRSFIVNDYEGDKRLLKKGTPEGHLRLNRLLLIPIFSEFGGIIGTAGVANKVDEYTSSDKTQLNLLMNEMFAIFARREELKRVSAPAQVVREITDVGTTGIAFVTIDMEIVFLNRVAMSVLGVESESSLPIGADGVSTPQMQTLMDLVNRLRTHGGPSVKGGFDVRIGGRNRSYAVVVYSTAGSADMHPGFTAFMDDVTDYKRMDESATRMKEHVSILEGPVLESLRETVPILKGYRNSLPDDARSAVDKANEEVMFIEDYRNVGMRPPIWIDLEDAVESARKLAVPDGIEVSARTNGIKILADPSFPSVFKHLFVNSVMHSEGVKSINVRCSITDGYLTIICEDDGIGIDPGIRDRIFDMVYEGKFGMFLIYHIAAASGFKVSCPDASGARFEISVPPLLYSLG